MTRERKHHTFSILMAGISILSVFIFLTGCDQSFEPFQENDRYVFSMYGYLDASADTQWVRVMPVRDSVFLSPDPIDATVTIEHLGEGGETVIWNDSLFYYGHDAYAWNFWTTQDLMPAQTYRLRAERSDGEASSVTVTLPEDFPTPAVEVNIDEQLEYVNVNGVENLADVHSNHRLQRLDSGLVSMFTFSHHQDTVTTPLSQGEHKAQINPSEATEYLEFYYEENPYSVLQREIFVASAGPDWHYFPDIDEEIIALPDGISNVENGVGYVVGIVSKTISWEITCFDEVSGDPLPFPCPY